MPVNLASIPYLGSGLGYREELADGIAAARDEIDFVEVLADNYISRPQLLDELREIRDLYPVIPHGVGLSIGTVGPVPPDYLAGMKRVSDVSGAPYYSDHLCMTKVPGIDLHHLAPIWRTEEVLESIIGKVDTIQQTLGKPLVLETISYLVDFDSPISEPDFYHRLTERTGCGILLDLTNVYSNSVNHLFDPLEYLLRLPLDHVVQVHLAGGFWAHGVLIDGHSHPVPEEVWELLAELCRRIDLKASILEQDANLDSLRPLLEQVWRARSVIRNPVVA